LCAQGAQGAQGAQDAQSAQGAKDAKGALSAGDTGQEGGDCERDVKGIVLHIKDWYVMETTNMLRFKYIVVNCSKRHKGDESCFY